MYKKTDHKIIIVSCSNCGSAYCVGCRRTCPICKFDTRASSKQVYPRKGVK